MVVPRGRRLGSLDLGEKLVEHPHEVVVVGTSENLGHESPALHKKLDSQLQAHKHDLRLTVCVLNPGCSDIWSTVMKYHIRLPVLELSSNEVPALRGRDVGGKGRYARNRFDGD